MNPCVEAVSIAEQAEAGPNVGLYAPPSLCVECGALPAARGDFTAGLCVICLRDDEKRLRHGLGVKDFSGKAALSLRATAALPGSEEKISVLEERARLGYALWHPADEPLDREAHEADGVDCQVGLRKSYGRVVSIPSDVLQAPRESVLDLASAGAW
jgi:hypothetical protein